MKCSALSRIIYIPVFHDIYVSFLGFLLSSAAIIVRIPCNRAVNPVLSLSVIPLPKNDNLSPFVYPERHLLGRVLDPRAWNPRNGFTR
jgi:hypothetical protein